ncbi:MAG: hypothetical protein PVH63_03525, partial [Balneolaceae bacterium]
MELKTSIIGFIAVLGLLISCSSKKESQTVRENDESNANVIEVAARDFAFEAPAEVPSGWNTFRFTNNGQQEHFLYIYRLPENKTYDQFLEEAMKPFGSVWNEYASGAIDRDSAMAKMGAELPAWFMTELTPSGGVGLTEPGETAETTVKLDPGLHVLECYVKMPDGTWHTEMGMQQPMTVTPEASEAKPPSADVELTLSNYKIEREGEYKSGPQTVAIHVAENPQGFTMHNLDLFRLNDTTDVQQIVNWMDWMNLDEFKAPAPAYSLGGI